MEMIDNMEKLALHDFLERLSSKAPVPGGGGASAAAGAMSIALGMMVGNLTVGKSRYQAVEGDIRKLLLRGETLIKELERLMNLDAEAFEPLSRAYGLPRNTEEEKKKRDEIMEAALYEASIVPLTIMEKILEVVHIHDELSQKGSRLAISDVGAGVLFAHAALESASLNVFMNTRLMKNRARADELNNKAETMIESCRKTSNQVYTAVLEQIR